MSMEQINGVTRKSVSVMPVVSEMNDESEDVMLIYFRSLCAAASQNGCTLTFAYCLDAPGVKDGWSNVQDALIVTTVLDSESKGRSQKRLAGNLPSLINMFETHDNVDSNMVESMFKRGLARARVAVVGRCKHMIMGAQDAEEDNSTKRANANAIQEARKNMSEVEGEEVKKMQAELDEGIAVVNPYLLNIAFTAQSVALARDREHSALEEGRQAICFNFPMTSDSKYDTRLHMLNMSAALGSSKSEVLHLRGAAGERHAQDLGCGKERFFSFAFPAPSHSLMVAAGASDGSFAVSGDAAGRRTPAFLTQHSEHGEVMGVWGLDKSTQKHNNYISVPDAAVVMLAIHKVGGEYLLLRSEA